ncbi:MAG: DUF547 domain-containing protein [Gammaproteobacteria bacterium]|nr:DUF547 domain-containing protein [Gammaproteobacteria bacterium]
MRIPQYFLPAAFFIMLSLAPDSSYAKDIDLAEYFAENAGAVTIDIVNDDWNRILETYIQENDGINLFGYSKVTDEDRASLNRYIAYLASLDVFSLTAAQQFSFWTNLYNSLTILVILDEYPVKSIRDISSSLLQRGPWKKKLVTVDGIKLSLDDIEHEILRPVFNDNRVHYAVNCASIGCPNLQQAAFTHETLDEMLDKAASEYINHPRGVTVNQGHLTVSSIFKWYSDDFGQGQQDVINHMLIYANDELAASLRTFSRISGYAYDWDLNEYQ